MFTAIMNGLNQGLIWGLLAIGVFITFRILDFADLTVEGSFTTGAATAAAMISAGISPWIATIVSVFTGGAAGLITALLHTKLKVPPILAGILTMIGLYSINLAIMSGRANISLNGDPTVFSQLQDALNIPSVYSALIFVILVSIAAVALCYWYFGTESGASVRATGNNEKMCRAQGINTDNTKILALVISNAFVGLCGALIAQNQNFADISMGVGAIVIGLASVIIGETLFGKRHNFMVSLIAVFVGSAVYRIIITLCIMLDILPSAYLKLLTAVIVAVALSIPSIKKLCHTLSQRKMAKSPAYAARVKLRAERRAESKAKAELRKEQRPVVLAERAARSAERNSLKKAKRTEATDKKYAAWKAANPEVAATKEEKLRLKTERRAEAKMGSEQRKAERQATAKTAAEQRKANAAEHAELRAQNRTAKKFENAKLRLERLEDGKQKTEATLNLAIETAKTSFATLESNYDKKIAVETSPTKIERLQQNKIRAYDNLTRKSQNKQRRLETLLTFFKKQIGEQCDTVNMLDRNSNTDYINLKIMGLTKVFNRGTVNEKVALSDVSIDIHKGDFVTVIGGNGAGKSTLLNMTSGVYDMDQGRIFLDGDDVTTMPEYRRASYLGRVFQDPMMGTAASMEIVENLALAARRGKRKTLRWSVGKDERKDYVEQLKRLDLGLETRLSSKVGLLSGGQRQALTLLMATLVEPKLLLLDEHTAALDPKTAKKVLDLTEVITSSRKLTTMMITHNMNDALRLGNRLIMMHEGRIIFDVEGEEKKRLTVDDLLKKFETVSGQKLADEKMLLTD